MCGICGMTGPVDVASLKRMVAALVHRGPDDGGIYVSENHEAGLGSRRLSVIDLSAAGHMPMVSTDGAVTLVYNGEIYNFQELRSRLEAAGHRFRSHSDTEVIVHGYEEWAVDLFARLNGIFALALWDSSKHQLLLARDRHGVKPLYYTSDYHGRLLFASEVKALIAGGYRCSAIEPAALHRLLTFLWVPGPRTMFPGVMKLPPGHWGEWHEGALSLHRFWTPSFRPQRRPKEETATELRQILESAVRRQLVADVPVGIFLSGGLDSTALLGLSNHCGAGPVDCFTIAFRAEDTTLEQSADDAKFAKLAASALDARLHMIEVSPRLVDLLPRVIWHLDEPIADPAAITTLLISEAARSRVKVLLSGQGADEIFGGYRVYSMPMWAERVGHMPPWLRNATVNPLVEALPRIKDKLPGVHPGLVLAAHRYLSKMLQGVDLPPDERYVFYRSHYRDDGLRKLYSPEMQRVLAGEVAGSEHLEYLEEVCCDDFLNRMLYLDWKTFLPELNLAYCDKMSMAASVETRVPFLDNEVTDFMLTVPADEKIRGRVSKYILREAVKDIVPEPILRRRKAGFGAPIRTWLRRDLREMVDDLLSAERIKARGYFDPMTIQTLVRDDREGRADNTYRIWTLLTLELWQQVFMEDRAH